MGRIHYGQDSFSATFDDRTLAHLQIVISAKLRRQEPFFFSWHADPSLAESHGRTSIWMHPAVPIRFEFESSEPIEIDRDWLERLSISANSNAGMHVTPDPKADLQPAS